MLNRVLNMARFLQRLFQPLGSLKYFTSFKVAFRIQIRKKKYYTLKIYLEKLKKNGDFIFTLLNKAMFTLQRIAFCSVSQYYTVCYEHMS